MTTCAFGLLAVIAIGLIGATLLPFIETKWWFVRLLDFPRVLFGLGLVLAALALAPFAGRFPRATLTLELGVLAALGTNAAVLWPYRPGQRAVAADCPVERTLSVMIANVQLGNRDAAPLLDTVAREKPDLFLAMETNEWWDKALAPVARDMPNEVKKITGSYYGIHFFSRLPVVDPEIRFFADRDTPAVVTGVTMRDGEGVRFVGLHPKPPLPGQSSLGRDAELYAAGRMLRREPGPALLAGDLNATPWEAAVARMRRIAGLADPRRGFGYVASWDTKRVWTRWPLDNIFNRGGFDLLSLERFAPFGSDHFPYMVRFCRNAGATAAPPAPESAGDEAAVNEAFAGAGVRGTGP